MPARLGDAHRERHGEGHAGRERAEAGMVRFHHLEPDAAHLRQRRKRRICKRNNGYAACRHGPRLPRALGRIGRKAHRERRIVRPGECQHVVVDARGRSDCDAFYPKLSKGIGHIRGDRIRPPLGDEEDGLRPGEDVHRALKGRRINGLAQGIERAVPGRHEAVEDRLAFRHRGAVLLEPPEPLLVARRAGFQAVLEDLLQARKAFKTKALREADQGGRLHARGAGDAGGRAEGDFVRVIKGIDRDLGQPFGQRRLALEDGAAQLVEILGRNIGRFGHGHRAYRAAIARAVKGWSAAFGGGTTWTRSASASSARDTWASATRWPGTRCTRYSATARACGSSTFAKRPPSSPRNAPPSSVFPAPAPTGGRWSPTPKWTWCRSPRPTLSTPRWPSERSKRASMSGAKSRWRRALPMRAAWRMPP